MHTHTHICTQVANPGGGATGSPQNFDIFLKPGFTFEI